VLNVTPNKAFGYNFLSARLRFRVLVRQFAVKSVAPRGRNLREIKQAPLRHRKGHGNEAICRWLFRLEQDSLYYVRVIITECECSPTESEWRVCDTCGQPLMLGWQKSRTDAKHEGERALFKLLASGGNIPLRKSGPIRGH
jgi:hypothetical protein